MMYRYQYDLNAPGAATQLRMTSTKDLNLNVSVSNANMLFQAYSSWNNLSHIDELYKEKVSGSCFIRWIVSFFPFLSCMLISPDL